MLAALFAAICFALSAVFAHRTTKLLGVLSANLARIWVAACLLGGLACLHGPALRGPALGTFFISGIIGFGVGDLALFAAYPRLGSRLTMLLMQCLSAPFAAAMEWLWLGTSPGVPALLCGGVILVGVGLAVAPPKHKTPNTVHPFVIGIGWGVLAALGQAGGVVVSRKAFTLSQLAGQDIDGFTAAFQRSLGGVLMITIAFVVARGLTRNRVSPGTRADWHAAWPWVLANSLAGPTLGVGCLQFALALTPSAIVLPVVALTPLIVIPFAYFLENERPSRRSLLGGVIAVAAAAVLAATRAH